MKEFNQKQLFDYEVPRSAETALNALHQIKTVLQGIHTFNDGINLEPTKTLLTDCALTLSSIFTLITDTENVSKNK